LVLYRIIKGFIRASRIDVFNVYRGSKVGNNESLRGASPPRTP